MPFLILFLPVLVICGVVARFIHGRTSLSEEIGSLGGLILGSIGDHTPTRKRPDTERMFADAASCFPWPPPRTPRTRSNER